MTLHWWDYLYMAGCLVLLVGILMVFVAAWAMVSK